MVHECNRKVAGRNKTQQRQTPRILFEALDAAHYNNLFDIEGTATGADWLTPRLESECLSLRSHGKTYAAQPTDQGLFRHKNVSGFPGPPCQTLKAALSEGVA